MSDRSLASRGVALGLAVVAGLVAWRFGGGAEAPAPVPRPDVASDGGASKAGTGDGYEVALRLVEAGREARFEIPNPGAASQVLRTHWRKMKPPFVALSEPASQWVTSIGLRASTQERQWATALGKDGAWVPDVRIWNMNEGSFDQREAFAVPAPSKITLRVNVPSGAKLAFAEGTVNATRDATVFVVRVVDGKGTHEVHRHRLAPAAARRWTEAIADLTAFAGQTVDLELATEIATATAEERAQTQQRRSEPAPATSAQEGPGNAREVVDGGVVQEDMLAFPSTPVALWGNPTILTRTSPRVPYNVVWIVVDALRPDVIASLHDDEDDRAKEKAPRPPLEALLPKVPGLTPAIDGLVARGARFTQAYSAACWTRPGTLAMLTGARSSELGIDTTNWLIPPAAVNHFYASDPPLLPLVLRRHGVVTRAFVNNYFMVGYAPIGIDMGFERVADHRYRTRDTLEVTQDATRWITDNKDQRFFLFVNYNSPHEPYEPPARLVERIPPAPAGPADHVARLYMAEAAKDDEGIGVLLRTLDESGLRDKTIVVVTADHGETLSSAHTGTSALDKMPIRYHHAVSNFEETTRVPIIVAGPGIPPGSTVKARVRTTDIAPTVLELLGLEPHPRMSGRSLVSLARGEREADERVVVTEGRMSRGIMHGRHRLIVREGPAKTTYVGDRVTTLDHELFDLQDDPGERHDLSAAQPEIVAEMKARLAAALENVAVAGTAGSGEASKPPVVHLRFAGGATPRRVTGTIVVGDARSKPKSVDVQPVEIGRDAFKIDGGTIDLALTTSPSAPVGFDLVIDPPGSPIRWQLWLDDKPWPDEAVFGGPFGLLTAALRQGLASDEARVAAQAAVLPTIDARRDVGLFVTRERRGEEGGGRETTDEGAEELARLLREWGYAHGSGGAK